MNDKIEDILLEKSIDVLIKLFSNRDRLNKKESIDYSKVFKEYLYKKFNKLSLLNSIVLRNSQTFLDEVYIPLTLVSVDKTINYKLSRYPNDLMDDFGLILITDTAGMGKSTIMKKIFLSSIIEEKGIPIFIELRRISISENIVEAIINELKLTNYNVNSSNIEYIFEQGGFIFFFDGFDEIPSENKNNVTKELQSFITKNFNNNKFLLTSRPEVALSSLGEFKEFNIQKLTLEESFDLIRKYDKTNSISDLLVSKLQESDMEEIHEFLVNPLLTSLLFLAFEYKQKIPLKKHLFYRQVYDANFENHDLTKGESFTRKKHCQLQSDDFHRILRHIGFQCLTLQKIEFEKDDILAIISKSQDFHNDLNFKASDFLNDLTLTVPLFTIDGNYYKWSHRSIQEYFAAQFIFKDSKEQQTKILQHIYNHQNIDYFLNTLELYYDIDYKKFREVIEFNLLKEYKCYYENAMSQYDAIIDLEEYKRRIEITFLKTILIGQDSRVQMENHENFYLQKAYKNKFKNSKKEKLLLSSLQPSRILMGQFFNSKYNNNDEIITPSKYNDYIGGVTTYPRYGLNTFYRYIGSKKSLLINLLYSKGKSYIGNKYSFIDDYIKIIIGDEYKDKVTKLTFNSSHPFNIGENFKLTNDLLMTRIGNIVNSDLILKEYEILLKEKIIKENEDFISF